MGVVAKIVTIGILLSICTSIILFSINYDKIIESLPQIQKTLWFKLTVVCISLGGILCLVPLIVSRIRKNVLELNKPSVIKPLPRQYVSRLTPDEYSEEGKRYTEKALKELENAPKFKELQKKKISQQNGDLDKEVLKEMEEIDRDLSE